MSGDVKGHDFYFYAHDNLGNEWPARSGGQPQYQYIEEWSDPSGRQPLIGPDTKKYWTYVPNRNFNECWNVADGKRVAMRHIVAWYNNESVTISPGGYITTR